MKTALVAGEPESAIATLVADLNRAGVHVVGAVQCQQLVQAAIRLSPDLVVISTPSAGASLFEATKALESLHPVAVAAFTEDGRAEPAVQSVESGIHAWIVRGYGAQRLRPVLQLAGARFARERRQREALEELSRRLEERKLVDRAKGILMGAGGMPEDEAFRTLRDAAMQGRQRVGEVSRRLIDAARILEAVNRAGQLRMLSQRLVKLHLLAGFGIEPRSVQALRAASVERLERNLAALGGLLSRETFGDLAAGVRAAWDSLRAAMERGTPPPGPREMDEAAERLLEAAETLTSALEAASPVPSAGLVNLAGRQRMLAQRVAKFALLAACGPREADRAAAQGLRDAATAFEDAMRMLRDSPLAATPDPATLEEAARAWEMLRRGVAGASHADGRLLLAGASEELLELFDRLTRRYERRLQVLVH